MTIRPTRRMLAPLLAAAAIVPARPRLVMASGDFPSRPIRMVIAAAPGGASDLVTRMVAQRMTEHLGQPIVVENRTGGDMVLAARFVRDSVPDGYTLFSLASGVTARPALFRDPGYDLLADFTAVGPMMRSPSLLMVGAGQPDRSLADLVARAKADPGKLSFATGGLATPQYLAAIKLFEAAGIELLHVPYRGNGPAMADVLAGRVDMVFGAVGGMVQHLRSGRARALALTAETRLDAVPDVPTMSELGYPGATFYLWFGIVAPARTPREAVARLSDALRTTLSHREMRERFLADGVEPLIQSPADFTGLMREEIAQMGLLIARTGIEKQ